ncbi:MAG: phage-related major capsid protein [Microbacteriaceae bacterium]|nr:phage-related major capsid protein [Microbacteriaceae bacterium]
MVTHFGREIEGEARIEISPAAKYFYLDRRRPGQDWPDARGIDGAFGSLASKGVVQSLHEPAYLLNVSGSNYIAIVRSSAGPSTSAIARWLNIVFGFSGHEERLELRAASRTDQIARLAQAQSASKVHLRIAPGAMAHGEDFNGELGKALTIAQSVATGSVSVDMTISFGNVVPTDEGGRELVNSIKELLNASTSFKKAAATLILENEDGEMIRDSVDFTRDRITIRQQVGADEDEEPTPAVVLDAMFEAIKKARKHL